MSDFIDALDKLDAQSGLASVMTSPAGTSLQDIAGPLFPGFAFQFFGMGVVLVLSANYYCSIYARPHSHTPVAPQECARLCCVIVVSAALVFNLAQTAVDMHRGWQMFATNFTNLLALLTPNVGYFLSPFLGIVPAALAQMFLLRRFLSFISSLSAFWPRLAHPLTRWTFGGVIGCMIVVSSSAGTIASVKIWKSPNLWSLNKDDRVSNAFQVAQLTWLTISSAVDVTLSAVLCLELWWARKHLASKGGAMRQVVTKLMFVTFHGGLAVTAIQLSALFLYQFATASSWCYFPVLSLPKIYNITLILSVSLPQGQAVGPSPSHVFSLPTIMSHHPSLALPPSPPNSHRPMFPDSPIDRLDSDGEAKDAKEARKRRRVTIQVVRSTVEKGWRISQEWIHWSLVGHPTDRHIERSSWDPERKGLRGNAGEGGEGMGDRDEWSAYGQINDGRHVDGKTEYRRPSEPNSLAPLLGALSLRRLSSVGLSPDVSALPAPEITADALPVSPTQSASPNSMTSPGTSIYATFPGLAAPLPSITVDRAHSFSSRDDGRRGSLPAATSPGQYDIGEAHTGGSSWTGDGLFDRPDPFASMRSSSSFTLAGTAQARRPSLSPLTDLRPHLPDLGPRNDDEDETYAREGRRRGARAGARMFSFEDMLAGAPDEPRGKYIC